MKYLLPLFLLAYAAFFVFIIHLVNGPWWR